MLLLLLLYSYFGAIFASAYLTGCKPISGYILDQCRHERNYDCLSEYNNDVM